ncbi:MAG: hypothetical protein LBD64_07475, partial [Odoribacteraceae bacterium]|nr:hypothetical protein [Odoribacteraceae bacterium]
MKATTILATLLLPAIMVGSPNEKEPRRVVLYTLGENEQVHYGEYFAIQDIRGDRFACVTFDAVKQTYTFVFNGKRVITSEEPPEILQLNVREEKGYTVIYQQQGKTYVNWKDAVQGPFDGAYSTTGNGDMFEYRMENDHYVWNSGVAEGPFEEVSFQGDSFSVPNALFYYRLVGRWYARERDGKNTRAYNIHEERVINNRNASDSRLTKSGNHAYIYKENGKWHVNINGRDSRGYASVYALQLTESGKYSYCYKENGKWHVNINGRDSRGYESVGYPRLTESGNHAYIYKENGKWHVNINGAESRPYNGYIYNLCVIEDGRYAFIYEENDKEHVNINGRDSRGYSMIIDLALDNTGACTFLYSDDDGRVYK